MADANTGYITYDEYVNLGGNAEASVFPLMQRKASRLLDLWTFDRLKTATTIPDVVKECLTEMINQMQGWQYGDDVTSFSNGKVSFTFDTTKAREQKLYYDTAYIYLPVSLISEVV